MNEDLMHCSYRVERALAGVVSSQVEQDDALLVQASQQGDQDAFALLVQRHQRRVFNLSLHMLQSYEDASESTQEAFVAAWRGLSSFRSEACFSTWLYRIACHCCLRQLERRKRARVLQTALQMEQMLSGVDDEQQAEQIREQHEQQALVREHLEQLPTRYRVVLILRHFQDRTYEEMAAMLTLPIGVPTCFAGVFPAKLTAIGV